MRRVGVVLFFCLSCATAALAAEPTPLSPADVSYLTKLGQSQKALTANRPTPAQLEQLHQLINDPATAGKPKAREEAVWRLLDKIEAHAIWCADRPADPVCGAEKAASAR
jgi:hypothetical protein